LIKIRTLFEKVISLIGEIFLEVKLEKSKIDKAIQKKYIALEKNRE
jgi:hypothetical protein